MDQHTDKPLHDLSTYLSNNRRFRSYIYDRREIQYIADQIGLTPERIRSELECLGYRLVKNYRGQLVWKNYRAEHMSYTKKIAPLEEYLSKCESRQLQFYDKSEVGRIANRTGVNREVVRAVLRRRGYELTANAHGIPVWIKNAGRGTQNSIY